ncbi:efflux RND transporter periplasmic adaptor subunit [Thiothrix fructosivorans]|uniref:Efflux RND transporter periplasmic adaptor subunit n=1 Tax=Thiothrix fructosivorans TaxID=111770 RepID=A0A8B0SRH9_9GAMM|nr:efflux RND transporter periplasmic adaptor subunit [Thiothrix fructosivorans]MBO0612211.1 efflux RND transporter periplasmic adaptor subunit [Thiothrix fructosivorans]QTX12297.1 efflux RND transporter periplasmic adaptor subunit [Thiothrix fructosivorans]
MRLSRFLLIVPLLAAGGWWVWQQQHPTALDVSAASVSRGVVESSVANTRAGTVKACRRAKLSPSMGGQISVLPFAEGAHVNTGDVLLRLWNHDLQANVEAADKGVQAARSQRSASCLQAAETRRAADRASRLRQSASISVQELDKASTAAAVTEATCQAAAAQITLTEAQLKATQAQLERTVLVAPFAGVIADINGELNEYVTPSPPGIQTLPVVDLIEPGCFLASAPIDEVDAPNIKTGLPARITLDAWRGRDFPGKVTRVGSYVIDLEKQARTVEVELAFDNPADLQDLLVGYSADVDIILETRPDVLRIPTEALFDKHYVYVLTDAGKLEKRKIGVGLSNWSFTEVTDGVAEGASIVTTPGAAGVAEGVAAQAQETTDE